MLHIVFVKGDRIAAMPQCSFCRKDQSDVLVLIAGPQAFICDECAMLAVEMISVEHSDWRDRLMRTLALLPKPSADPSP